MADLVFPYLLQKSPSTTLASQMSMVTRLSHILTTSLRMDTKLATDISLHLRTMSLGLEARYTNLFRLMRYVMRQTAQIHTQSQSKSQQQAATTTTQMRHTKAWSTFVRGFAAIKILIVKKTSSLIQTSSAKNTNSALFIWSKIQTRCNNLRLIVII